MDLVYTYKNGAKLYQGDSTDAKLAIIEAETGEPRFGFLALCAEEVQPPFSGGMNGARLRIKDRIPVSAVEAADMVRRINKCSEMIVTALKNGKSALVTCYAGKNRSGACSGQVLKRLGVSGEEAVRLIQRARGPLALSNKFFLELVLTQ